MALEQVEVVDNVPVKIGVFKYGYRRIDVKIEACTTLMGSRIVVRVESYLGSCFIDWIIIFKQCRVFNF